MMLRRGDGLPVCPVRLAIPGPGGPTEQRSYSWAVVFVLPFVESLGTLSPRRRTPPAVGRCR